MTHVFKVGEAVHKPYSPVQYGKVLATRVGQNGKVQLQVRWKDGHEEWVWELHLRSLDALVEDHERKIVTHRTNVEKAKAL